MSKNIDSYRTEHQGYGHPLTIIMSRKVRKEEKPHGKSTPSRKDKAQKFEIICLQHNLIFT